MVYLETSPWTNEQLCTGYKDNIKHFGDPDNVTPLESRPELS
jgi:hypothetical protein